MNNILVLGGGGPAGWNFIQSLNDTKEYNIITTDPNEYHLALISPNVISAIMISPANKRNVNDINSIIHTYNIDFVHAQPDSEVKYLSDNRENVTAKTFLPKKEIINTCQNKYLSAEIWEDNGIKTCKTLPIQKPSDIAKAIQEIGLPLWVRATNGAGGKGSTPVQNYETALHWIKYWQARGSDWEFMAQEYLPGKNIAVHTLWDKGELVVAQARERIEYIYPYLAPSGITGTPTVQRTINNPEMLEAGLEAVLALDNNPNGIYCVDLKGSKKGILIPTEINAGRFFTTSYFFTQAGLNMPDLYIKIGMGQFTKLPEKKKNPLKNGLIYVRHLDMGNIILEE
jgi:carbamoylphosphate synthase large subunit